MDSKFVAVRRRQNAIPWPTSVSEEVIIFDLISRKVTFYYTICFLRRAGDFVAFFVLFLIGFVI